QTIQRLRQTRLPLQRPTPAQAARPLLPTQLRVSRQENLALYPPATGRPTPRAISQLQNPQAFNRPVDRAGHPHSQNEAETENLIARPERFTLELIDPSYFYPCNTCNPSSLAFTS